MKQLYQFYLHFMVWLGAAPPANSSREYENFKQTILTKIPGEYQSRWFPYFVVGFIIVICSGALPLIVLGVYKPEIGASPYFPSTSQTIEYHGEFMTSGPTSLLGGAFLLFLFFVLRQAGKSNPILPIIATGWILIGVVHFFAVYSEVVTDLIFRFDLTKITEIQVENLSLDGTRKCPPLVIKDRMRISDGFERLRLAETERLSHEVFDAEGGYSIKLTFADFWPHYHYLKVYKVSTGGNRVKAVAPTFSSQWTAHAKGYDSPEFHEWVAKNIDPYFENCKL